MAPEHAVDVAEQDGVLVVHGFYPASEGHFRELGVEIAHAVVVRVLGQLHGEGGGALCGAVVLEDLHDGAAETAQGDTAVVVERAVLLQDEGIDEVLRHLFMQFGDAAAVLPVQGADFIALAVQHNAALRHALNLGDVVPPRLHAENERQDAQERRTHKGPADEDAQRPQDELGQRAREERDDAEGQGEQVQDGTAAAYLLIRGRVYSSSVASCG